MRPCEIRKREVRRFERRELRAALGRRNAERGGALRDVERERPIECVRKGREIDAAIVTSAARSRTGTQTSP